MYTETEKQNIEQVASVFKNYIGNSPYLDLVWSEKLGYLLLHIDPPAQDFGVEPDFIADGPHLCRCLLSEIATDVLTAAHNEDGITSANPLEIAEIRKLWEPFLSQLPEYRSLSDLILSGSAD